MPSIFARRLRRSQFLSFSVVDRPITEGDAITAADERIAPAPSCPAALRRTFSHTIRTPGEYMSEAVQIRKGLEGVVADTTSVSLVDGEAGRLYYRGHAVASLVDRHFTEVMHLIVFGE